MSDLQAPQKTLSERMSEAEQRLQLALQNATAIPSLYQDITALKGDLAGLKLSVAENEAALATANGILISIVGVLTDKNLVSIDDISDRVRENQDRDASAQLEQMITSGMVKETSEAATPESIVVLSVTNTNTATGAVELVRDSLITVVASSEIAASLVGKTAGESISGQLSQDIMQVTTVSKVYKKMI